MDELDPHYQDVGTEIPEEFPLEESGDESFVYPLENASDQLLGDGIKQLISKKSTVHFREFAEDLFREWGGPKQIAKALHLTYQQAPQGSMTRSRILDRVIAFIETVSKDSVEEEFDEETVVAIMIQEMRKHARTEVQLPRISEETSSSVPQHSDGSGDRGS